MPKPESNELGRRICAAILSYELGIESIDETLRTYVSDNIDPSWQQAGEMLRQWIFESMESAPHEHRPKRPR